MHEEATLILHRSSDYHPPPAVPKIGIDSRPRNHALPVKIHRSAAANDQDLHIPKKKERETYSPPQHTYIHTYIGRLIPSLPSAVKHVYEAVQCHGLNYWVHSCHAERTQQVSERDHDVRFGIREQIARCGFPHRSMRAVIAFSVGTVRRCERIGSRLSLQLCWSCM